MGQVYEGLQEQLGRRVAIKVLRLEYARKPELLTRFFNEARAVNVIKHQGLVQISEFGHRPDGCAYLVMEYLDGETLGLRLQRHHGRMPEPMVVRLGRQLASALAATHAHNIVHRDLKPGNIMLVPDPAMPDGERVKVLDFGIAKIVGESFSEQPQTRVGLLLGTPLYMSPEQCRGAGQVDDKSDVYSLGVILYQLLAGQPPFKGDGDMAVIAMHLCDQPRPLRELAPQTSEPLAALIHQMLHKDKAERPSMREIHGQLVQLDTSRAGNERSHAELGVRRDSATGLTPLQHPSTMRHSTGQMGEQRRGLPRFTVAAVAAVVAGVALFVSVRSLSRQPDPRPVARPAESAGAKPEVRRVHWAVTSIPLRAEVFRAEDNHLLGQTPWQFEQPLGHGHTDLILRYPGYRERRIVADHSESGVWQESLEPLEPTAEKSAGHKETRKPAAKGPLKQNPCPKDPACSARAKHAMELYHAKQYDQALQEFQTAYTMTQDAPRLLVHIGLCIFRLGRTKQALQYYQSYLRAEPDADSDFRNRVNGYIAEANAALTGSN